MNERIYQLLAKKMADELSQAETNELNAWLNASAENKHEAEAIERTWSITGSQANEVQVDVDKAWTLLQQHVAYKKKSKIRIMTWASVAAAFIVMVGVAWFNLKSKMPTNPSTPMVASNQVFEAKELAKTFVLEDQTEVRLMPHSILKVNKDFNSKHREVELSGVAHFTTHEETDLNFTVLFNGTRVIDISTSFTVNTNNNRLAVKVTQGTVKIAHNNELTTITTDDSIWIMGEKLYLYEEPTTQKEKDEKKVELLKPEDKNLEFRNTELSEVVKIVNSLYHSNLSIGSEAIKTCKFTSTFKNEDLDVIVDILQQSFNLEIVKRNGQIVLLGKGCN